MPLAAAVTDSDINVAAKWRDDSVAGNLGSNLEELIVDTDRENLYLTM